MSLLLLPILFIGLINRFYHNTAIALWHDEAFSALYIRDYGWGEMMHRIGLDVHPPFYYLILRLWSDTFGSGLLSLRSLSILFGVLTIWAGYLFVKQLFGDKKLALLSALLLALNPFQIQYSLEARMYTLGTFLILFSSYLLLKALETNQKKFWLWYGILTAASLYTHYYLFFSVAAQGLYVIYYFIRNRKINLRAISAYLLALVLYLPWVPTFIAQNRRVQQAYWIPRPDRWSIPGTVWKMVFGGEGINRPVLILATIVALVLIVYFIRKIKIPAKWLVVLSIIVPFLGAVLLSVKTAIYLDRYFVFASLFFTILIAAALYQIPKFSVRRLLISVLIITTLVAFFKNWKDLEITKKPGMAKASEFINERTTKTDKIYIGSSFVFFTFKYYNQTGIIPLLYSVGPLESIPHFSGTALLTNDDLILDFRQASKNDNVWLVWTTGFGGSKPNVPGNWSKVDEKSFADAPGFKGDIMVTQYHVQ